MNLNILRLRVLRAIDAVLSIFDRGIDGAVDAFTKADRQLEAVKAKIASRITREFDLQVASYAREQAIRNAENARRSDSYERVDGLLTEHNRAAKVQRRIGELLN